MEVIHKGHLQALSGLLENGSVKSLCANSYHVLTAIVYTFPI